MASAADWYVYSYSTLMDALQKYRVGGAVLTKCGWASWRRVRLAAADVCAFFYSCFLTGLALVHAAHAQVAMVGSGAWACAAVRMMAQNAWEDDPADEFVDEVGGARGSCMTGACCVLGELARHIQMHVWES